MHILIRVDYNVNIIEYRMQLFKDYTGLQTIQIKTLVITV